MSEQKARLALLRTLIEDEIGLSPDDTRADLKERIHNADILDTYIDGGDVPRYLACVSEGFHESSFRDNPDFFAGDRDAVSEWAAANFYEGWALRWVIDLGSGRSLPWSVSVKVGDAS